MSIPNEKTELAKYLHDSLIKPAEDKREESNFDSDYEDVLDHFQAEHTPDDINDNDFWVQPPVVYPTIVPLEGVITRADRRVNATPVGQEDAETAELFARVAEKMFDDGNVYDCLAEAINPGLLHGVAAVRSSVDAQGNLVNRFFEPNTITVDPDASGFGLEDRKFLVYKHEVGYDTAKARWGDQVEHASWKGTAGTRKVVVREIEWWCPHSGKVWASESEGRISLEPPEQHGSAVPEEDRKDWFEFESTTDNGFWRITTILDATQEKGIIVEDKPTGLTRSIWSLFVLEKKRKNYGFVGLGKRLSRLEDAAAGALTTGLDGISQGKSFLAAFANPLDPKVREAIERGDPAVIDNQGENVHNNARLFEYPTKGSEKALDAAVAILSMAEKMGGTADVVAGRTPHNPESGEVVTKLTEAASNNTVRIARRYNHFGQHLVDVNSELIQRKIPYKKLVRVADPKNEDQYVDVPVGVEPPQSEETMIALLQDRFAKALAYDLSIEIDVEEAILRATRARRAETLLTLDKIDIEAYLHMVKDPEAQIILKGLNERDEARSLVQFILTNPQAATLVQGMMQAEQLKENLNTAILANQEKEENHAA